MPIADIEWDNGPQADSAPAVGTTHVGELVAATAIETGDGTAADYRLNTDEAKE